MGVKKAVTNVVMVGVICHGKLFMGKLGNERGPVKVAGCIFGVVVKVASENNGCGGVIVKGFVDGCSKLDEGCREFDFFAGCREVYREDNDCVMVWRRVIEGTEVRGVSFKDSGKGIDMVEPNDA